MNMPLNADIATLLSFMPPMPSLRQTDISTLRQAVNAASAGAPRYDVPLGSIRDTVIDTDAGAIPVRIYTPRGEGPFPLIVYYHGGGFVIGDLEIADPICRALAAGTGSVLMSVDYRLSPEHPFPAPNDDGWAALQWAARNAASIDADPGRIAVAGDSAGANLSTSMTLRARAAGLTLAAQALLYPSPDYPDLTLASYRDFPDGPLVTADDALFYWEQYLPDPRDRRNPDAMPALAGDHSGLPPAFVSLAECDPSRDTGHDYAGKLTAAGVPVVLRCYEGMPHGFYGLVAHIPAVRAAMDELCAWLKTNLAAVPARKGAN